MNNLIHFKKTSYFLPDPNIADEVFTPCFELAQSVDLMFGYFSISALADFAPGLASYLKNSTHCIRLIISPNLSKEDISAIEEGMLTPEELAEKLLPDDINLVDALTEHTLKCFAYLISKNRIEIKIALKKEGLFHPKSWIFNLDKEAVLVHGSANLTSAAHNKNTEHLQVSCSWGSKGELEAVDNFKNKFEQLCCNKEPDCIVFNAPQALKEKILTSNPSRQIPSVKKFERLWSKYKDELLLHEENELYDYTKKTEFAIPDWLEYKSGPFTHQGDAVDAWINAGYRGVLEMATGSGKTITSMICAYELYRQHKPLLVSISAPFKPLISQWCKEVETFGSSAIDLPSISSKSLKRKLISREVQKLKSGYKEIAFIVMSNDALKDNDYIGVLNSFPGKKLLISDEVHNLGAEGFISSPPRIFDYHLGLSATPVRQYDQTGTDKLFDFFGDVVYQYPLEKAIGNCLTNYEYYVHLVYLTDLEFQRWEELTEIIKRNSWRNSDSEGKDDNFLVRKLTERKGVLNSASNKISALNDLLQEDSGRNIFTLIYTSDSDPEQMIKVNKLLRKSGIKFHKVTADVSSNKSRLNKVLNNFRKGYLDVLTAKRVLDEGVNIPEIRKAYILASSNTERQWIQRRGRLLRKAPGKEKSIIHDFFTLPPLSQFSSEESSIINSELTRIREFAELALNANADGGPMHVVAKILNKIS